MSCFDAPTAAGFLIGDLCELYSLSGLNDVDEDGFCADVNNCPLDPNPDQFDMDGDGVGDIYDDPIECPADVDGNGVIGVVALLTRLAAWGPCPDCAGDINGDGVVDVVDLLELVANRGACQ